MPRRPFAKANEGALQARRLHRLFRVLCDPIRLQILYLLSHAELSVSELVASLRRPQPTVSRHLAYLRRSGLVRVRRQGTNCFYRLTPARYSFHRRLLHCLKMTLSRVEESAAALARLRSLRASRRSARGRSARA